MDNGLFFRQVRDCRHISVRRPDNRQLGYYKTDNDDDDDDDDDDAENSKLMIG